jgi:hypothetical protein
METFNLELTQEQLNNLIVFLNRTKLEGMEVPAFVELMQKIQKNVSKNI